MYVLYFFCSLLQLFANAEQFCVLFRCYPLLDLTRALNSKQLLALEDSRKYANRSRGASTRLRCFYLHTTRNTRRRSSSVEMLISFHEYRRACHIHTKIHTQTPTTTTRSSRRDACSIESRKEYANDSFFALARYPAWTGTLDSVRSSAVFRCIRTD